METIIYGGANANGGFTVKPSNGIELGLLRFNASNQPENTFNSNGDGTYSFAAGVAPGGFGSTPNAPSIPVWSFEWSVNSNFVGNGVGIIPLPASLPLLAGALLGGGLITRRRRHP